MGRKIYFYHILYVSNLDNSRLVQSPAPKPHRVGFGWMLKFHRTPQIKIDKAVQPV